MKIRDVVVGSLWILVAAASSALGACSSGDDSGGAGGAHAASGSDGTGGIGSGGSQAYNPPTCGQSCQDYLVAYGLNATIWFLWNANLAGRPSGTQDTVATCPLGGIAHITGTTGVSDNGINTVDVLFDLDECANSGVTFSLAFSASVAMQGTFESGTDFAALTFSTQSLDVSGSLDYRDDPAIDEACEVDFSQQGMGESGSLVGRVCGREFNSTTAFETEQSSGGSGATGSSSGGSGATGSSSGGSGATGSSSGGTGGGAGTDCRCFCPDGSDCTGAPEPNPCGVDSNGIPEVCGCPLQCL